MDNRNDYYNQIPNKQSWEYRYYRNTKLANAFFFAALAGLFLGTLILPFIFAPLCIIFAYLAKGNRE